MECKYHTLYGLLSIAIELIFVTLSKRSKKTSLQFARVTTQEPLYLYDRNPTQRSFYKRLKPKRKRRQLLLTLPQVNATMENINLTEAEESILSFGLETIGFREQQNQRTNQNTKLERFSSSFGAWPQTCCGLLTALEGLPGFAPVKLRNFFLAMFWLKNYPAEPVLAGIFKMTENTVRKWIWKFGRAIQSLKESKVR